MIWRMKRDNKKNIRWFQGFSEFNFKETLIFFSEYYESIEKMDVYLFNQEKINILKKFGIFMRSIKSSLRIKNKEIFGNLF